MKPALTWTVIIVGLLAIGAAVVPRAQLRPASSIAKSKGLTDVAGIRVRFHTLAERPTG